MSNSVTEKIAAPGPNVRQSGFFLITAILFIAVVSVSSIYLIDSSYSLWRKTQRQVDSEQLHQVAKAVEDYGIRMLYWDNWFDTLIWHDENMEYELPRPSLEGGNPLGYDPHNDSLLETWSKPHIPEFLKNDLYDNFVEQDVIYITDLNRYFNINNLHFSNSLDVKQAFDLNVRIFKALVSQIVDEHVNKDRLVNEIIDWLDHDNDSRSAILLTESDLYRRAGASYRPPNRPINNIGELRHVLGMTPEIFAQLSKFLVSLPVFDSQFSPYKQAFSPHQLAAQNYSGAQSPRLSKININTCPPELLKAMFASFNLEGAVTSAINKQGYFQNINKTDALNFRTFISHSVYSSLNLQMNELDRAYFLRQLEYTTDLVASEYSQFYLIESFFQNKNGMTFNHESLVYKFKTQFNYLPIVIQRQFDFLPLQITHVDSYF